MGKEYSEPHTNVRLACTSLIPDYEIHGSPSKHPIVDPRKRDGTGRAEVAADYPILLFDMRRGIEYFGFNAEPFHGVKVVSNFASVHYGRL